MRISYPIFAFFSARMRFPSSCAATARAGVCRITAACVKVHAHVRSLLSRIITDRIITSGVVAIHSRNCLFIVIGVERAFLATQFCNFVECCQKKMSYMVLLHIPQSRNINKNVLSFQLRNDRKQTIGRLINYSYSGQVVIKAQ